MKQLLFLIALNASLNSFSQTHIEFDTCFVYNRLDSDSTFKGTGLFVGNGAIDIYRDSIVLQFSNDWECGKYIIDLNDSDGRVNGKNFVWYYRGRERYRLWDMSCIMVVDNKDKPIYFELQSGFSNIGEESFAQTSRVYKLR